MRTGTHGSSVGIVAMIGVLSPTPCPRSRARWASNLAAMNTGLRAA